MHFLHEIYDWSEVWALLIPLFVLLKYPKQPPFFRPVIAYVVIALILCLLIDTGWKLKKYHPSFYKEDKPIWLYYNLYLYNLHSMVRFACFSAFFILLQHPFQQTIKRVLPFAAFLFVLLNFTVLQQDFFDRKSFSSRLLATEAGLLLVYCLFYYLHNFQEELQMQKRSPDFWVVLGLSFYVVLNFFYFLFYESLTKSGYEKVMEWTWNLHNATFIIFCIFIAKGFYASRH